MRIELQPAYVLHSRPFRDTSLLVDFFTQNYGRLTLVAKGARNPKRQQRSLLQPFQPVTISWQGKGELKTLIGVESADRCFSLVEQYLYSALYANELLMYLLAQGDTAVEIYALYDQLLNNLEKKPDLEPLLRRFEFSLLEALGYGVNFESEANQGRAIKADEYYAYISESGFVLKNECPEGVSAIYSGAQLIAIAEVRYEEAAVRQVAKKITRTALSILLQGKKIKSRELFLHKN